MPDHEYLHATGRTFDEVLDAEIEEAEKKARRSAALRRPDIDYDQAVRLLNADFETGKLYWLARTPDMFTDGKHTAKHRCANWNGKFAGKEAFTAFNNCGYRHGDIFNRQHLAHRVLWLLAHREWPVHHIDHINGDRSDNRLVNLRAVTTAENNRNSRLPSTNTSGVMGIYWSERLGKWMAQIKVNGRSTHLGTFSDKAHAIAARKSAEMKHGFHANHGRG